MSKLVSEDQVKKALHIEKFSEISKDKIMEFVSLIPDMDKEVAMAVINQFPSYTEYAGGMIAQLSTMSDEAIKNNDASQKDAIEAYKKILDELGELLIKDNLSLEERESISNSMILVADKIAAKDSENKAFLHGVVKTISGATIVLAMIGVTILGVNVKGNNIPSLKG